MIIYLTKRSRSQSILEYAVFLAMVAAALIAMQAYVRRNIQGRIKSLADQIAPTEQHYEPGSATSSFTVRSEGNVETSMANAVVDGIESVITTTEGTYKTSPKVWVNH